MDSFSVRVLQRSGKPAPDIGVMIDYGFTAGCEEKKTHTDGWVDFESREHRSGVIWVNGSNKGNHSISAGKTYSFTL